MIFNARLIEELAKNGFDVANVNIKEYIDKKYKFLMLLLYKETDNEMKKFIIEKSKTIDFKSGYINIHTYSSIIPDLNKISLENQNKCENIDYAFNLMAYIGNQLGLSYDEKFPVIVLLDIRKDNAIKTNWFSLKDKNATEIADILGKVIDVLYANIDNDFDDIKSELRKLEISLSIINKNGIDEITNTTNMQLKHVFEYAREMHHITQADVAKKIGMNSRVLSTWVSGTRIPQKSNVSRIIDICYNLMVDDSTVNAILSYYHWKIDEKVLADIYKCFSISDNDRCNDDKYKEFKEKLQKYKNELDN